ncbi:D-alanyl-D-alanine carboxypeptidase, partial [Kitasatospora putterlickiae]
MLGTGGAYAQPSPTATGSASPGGRPTGNAQGDEDEGNGRRDDTKGGKGDRGDKNGTRPGNRGSESPHPSTSATATPGTATTAGPTGDATGTPPAAEPAGDGAVRPVPAGTVLAAAGAGPDTGLPTAQGLQQALAAVLADRNLGTVGLAVADTANGQLLYGSGENTAATPASTTKLATSIAALSLIPGDARLTTRVVKNAATGGITLVGGGDPTLTALSADQVQIGGVPADADTAPASLDALARQTAAALKAEGAASVVLDYDVSLYSGGPLHKNHDAENIAAVTPLMVDEGKVDPKSREDAPARVGDPAS